MKKISALILLTVFLASTAIACKQQVQKQANNTTGQQAVKIKQTDKKEITVTELQYLIDTDSNLVILDVRTPEELNGPLGHIKGVINIPVQVLDKRAGELAEYKNDKIYVICRSGHRSGIATELLSKKGFNVINVLGGMISYNRIKK